MRKSFLYCLVLFLLTPPLIAQDKKESWEELDKKGTELFNEQNYEESLMVFVRAVAAAKKEFGVAHVNYANALQSEAVLLLYLGRLEESEKAFLEALKIHTTAVGKNNPEYEGYLNGVVSLYLTMGNSEKAMSYYEESCQVASALHEMKSEEYIACIKGLADQYLNLGNTARAETLLLEAKALADKSETSLSGDICTRLFQIYSERGDLVKADPYFLEAKRIRNKFQEQYWKTLDFKNMDFIYQVDDQDARLTYWNEQAAALKAQDGESVMYASALLNLALIYQTQEDYTKAEQALITAKKIIEENGTDYELGSLSNMLAYFYDNIGNKPLALKYYEDQLVITKRYGGRDHINYGTACQNQSTFYLNNGNPAKAEALAKTAILVFAGLNDGFTYYIGACASLSLVYEKKADLVKAEASQLESVKVSKMVFGEHHYLYASTILNLSRLYDKLKKTAQAEQLLVQAKQIEETIFGKDHIQYAGYVWELARFYALQQQFQRAAPFYKEASAIKLSRVQHNFGSLTEKEKKDLYRSGNHYFENYAYCLMNLYPQDKTAARDLYNLIIETKGLIYQSTTKTRSRILASNNAALIKQFHDWTAQREYLAKVYSMGLEERKKKNVDVSKLEEAVNATEKSMIQQATALKIGGLEENRRIDWKEIKSRLKPDEAAVEIIRATHDWVQGDAIYGALILTGQPQSEPQLIMLGKAGTLETKSIGFYNNSIRFKQPDDASYPTFWKPIGDKLKGITRIYMSPAGVYHQVSLATLKNPVTGKFLMEEHEIVIVGNTKDVLLNQNDNRRTGTTFLVGFPDYKGEENQGMALPSKDSTRSAGWTELSQSKERFFDASSGSVTPLPGTQKEVRNIEELLKSKNLPVSLLIGKDATEDQLKKIKDPEILHIATHGFFLANQRHSVDTNESAAKAIQDPLLRSGLLLAGCEQSLKGMAARQGMEDGVLTAFEAMNMSLDDTQLVVLSACETGLGEIDNGEGVYGLQRAFQQAGARFLLVSLWKVDDEATQLLMTSFYKSRLEGESLGQAFNKAREEVRAKYPEPYYWGAFVLIGT